MSQHGNSLMLDVKQSCGTGWLTFIPTSITVVVCVCVCKEPSKADSEVAVTVLEKTVIRYN